MKDSNTSSGLGLGGVLVVVFIVCKMAEVGWFATASWWWLVPFYCSGLLIVLAFVGALLGAAAVGVGFFALVDWATSGRRVR